MSNLPSSAAQGTFIPEASIVGVVHTNIKTDLILTTHDKLENNLLKHLDACRARVGWAAPLSFGASVGLALLTADFKSSFYLSGDFWKAIFVVLLFVSIAWFALSLFRLIRHWRHSTIQALIATIRATDAGA